MAPILKVVVLQFDTSFTNTLLIHHSFAAFQASSSKVTVKSTAKETTESKRTSSEFVRARELCV